MEKNNYKERDILFWLHIAYWVILVILLIILGSVIYFEAIK